MTSHSATRPATRPDGRRSDARPRSESSRDRRFDTAASASRPFPMPGDVAQPTRIAGRLLEERARFAG